MKLGLLPITGIIYHDFLFFSTKSSAQGINQPLIITLMIPTYRMRENGRQKNKKTGETALFPIMSVSGR